MNVPSMPVKPGLRDFASLVKFSHSVFALPFALLSLLVATAGRPPWPLLALVVVAAVAARTAAMAYNRLRDAAIDAANPRTASREIPRRVISRRAAGRLTFAASVVFVGVAVAIGPTCGLAALPVLAWLLAYSHMKHWTAACHLWLGVALGLAPIAAWIAAADHTGGVAAGTSLWMPLLLGGAVALWVAGFDVLYACQDEAFDRAHGLHSIPAAIGAPAAMWLARGLHATAFSGFAAFGVAAGLQRGYLMALVAAAGLLIWQHRLLRPGDLRRIHTAFFTANGTLSVVILVGGCVDLYLWRP
ncbi:MAG: UbiA family prenyltransferase [Planctomycetes bacterium]|nr:UbiA family prenyltransferase [Planctomycetota bacterium]